MRLNKEDVIWDDEPIQQSKDSDKMDIERLNKEDVIWDDEPIQQPKDSDKMGIEWDSEKTKPGIIRRAANYITGSGKAEFPELGEFRSDSAISVLDPKSYKLAAGLIFSSSPEQRIAVIKHAIPDASFFNDSKGNPMVSIPGKGAPRYINKPGFSYNDALELVGKGVLYFGGGRLFSAILGGAAKGLLGKESAGYLANAVATGLGEGTASMAEDVIAGSAAGEGAIKIDPIKAGIAFSFGTGSELLITPIANQFYRLYQRLRKTPGPDEAREYLISIGFDPDGITDDFINKFLIASKDALDPQAAARYAEAQSLPVPVPQTRGGVTLTPNDQMLERLATEGAYGDVAQRIMSGAEKDAQAALRENAQNIQGRLSGGQRQVLERGQGGEQVQSRFVDQYSKVKESRRLAYDRAKEKSIETISGTDSMRLFDDVSKTSKDYFPQAEKAVPELERLRDLTSDVVEMGNIRMRVPKTPGIKELFDWRAKVSKLQRAAARSTDGATDEAAFSAMKRGFDRVMSDIISDALMNGRISEAKLWAAAIKRRLIQANIFEVGDMVSLLVKKTSAGQGRRLAVAPEAAGNFIFGASNTGIINRPQLARELDRMRKLLPAKDWNALREEAFLRLADQAGDMSKFKKTWDAANSKNPEVIRKLFSQEERRLITQFANVAARETSSARGRMAFRNTGPAIIRAAKPLVNSTLGRLSRISVFLSAAFPDILGSHKALRAARNVSNPLPKTRIPGGYIGTAGSLPAVELYNDED